MAGILVLPLAILCLVLSNSLFRYLTKQPRDKNSIGLIDVLVIIAIIGILASIIVPVLKPVIYLYPEHEQDTVVQLDYAGKLVADYPALDQELGGWKVTAYPDAHLVDPRDGKEYSYLFWEGEGKQRWDLSTGFVVKGSETRTFLQEILPRLGLTPREYNEFIVFWYPLMQNNRFNLIHFAGKEYTDTAKLTVTPEPDTVIRVFMVWKPLATAISIPAQQFAPTKRKGFTVVEWGGAKVK